MELKQRMKKAKDWAKEHKWEIAGTILVAGTGATIATKHLSKNKPMSEDAVEFMHEIEKFIGMAKASDWQHVGSGRNEYKLSDLGKIGLDLLESAKECGIENVDLDSEITGIYLHGMKVK